jgi:hypothetical protein
MTITEVNQLSDAPLIFNFGAALDDGSLYVSGVSRELESRDVYHTVIWERIRGVWQRYQWKNRTDGVVAFTDGRDQVGVYMGLDGSMKVRAKEAGSSLEIVEQASDGPSTLRPLSGIRIIDGFLYACGMRRMVYRRSLCAAADWERFDYGLRLDLADLRIAGLNSIDGTSSSCLIAVGMSGEIWRFGSGAWRSSESPTNLDLFAVRCAPNGRTVVAGANGLLMVASAIDESMTVVDHEFAQEGFTCVEFWGDRCFVSSIAGNLFELSSDTRPELRAFSLGRSMFVRSLTSSRTHLYVIGRTEILSVGASGVSPESPPEQLLT